MKSITFKQLQESVTILEMCCGDYCGIASNGVCMVQVTTSYPSREEVQADIDNGFLNTTDFNIE